MTERLWAPWRMEYIKSAAEVQPPGCIFCGLLTSGDDRDRLVLFKNLHAAVIMNKYPYNNGHVLVMPRAHVGRFENLNREAFLALNDLLLRTINTLDRVLKPHAMNVGMNLGLDAGAGIPDHMHYHVVPRWTGDTNFMPVISETKVISQHVLDTYDLLKPHFG